MESSSTLQVEAERALEVLKAALVRETSAPHRVDEDGVVHALRVGAPWGCQGLLRREGGAGRGLGSAAERPTTARTRTLGELLGPEEELCEECVSAGTLLPATSVVTWTLGALRALERSAGPGRSSAREVRSRRRERDQLTARFADLAYHPTPTVPDGGEGGARRLLAQVEEAVSAAEEELRCEQVSDRVHKRVQVALVGRRRYHQGYELDETSVLVGLETFDPTRWNDVVGTLVETSALRNDGAGGTVVLQVPRYVAEYVSTLPSARHNGLHPSATVGPGDTCATLETAAALWEPDGDGAMASLLGALSAARRV